MSTPEFLNVDDILPTVTKVIKIKGVKYTMEPPKVGDFLDEMKRVSEYEKLLSQSTKADYTKILEAMVDSMKKSILVSFPKIPDDVMDRLTYDQMEAIRTFIKHEIKEDSKEAEDASGN